MVQFAKVEDNIRLQPVLSSSTSPPHFDYALSQSDKVEMEGTCLGEPKSIQQKVVFNSCKLCYYPEDTFTRNCVQGFSDIRRNEKFYYGHSAKKCIKYSFDSRAHLKTERCLCFPNSDRLETWLLRLSSELTWSRLHHGSTMV